MKYDDDHVKRTAKAFIESWQARAWTFVTADVRRALLDSFVLDELRLAHEYDEHGRPTGHNGGATQTASEHACAMLNFRDRVERMLASGVRLGSRSIPRTFRIHNDA